MVPAVPRLQHNGDIGNTVSYTDRSGPRGGRLLLIQDMGSHSTGAPEGLNEAVEL